MKREKRLTKRERKDQDGGKHDHEHGHIHCIACGRHIDPQELNGKAPTATVIICAHQSQFACCTGCKDTAQYLVDEHDRTGKPVNHAPVYH
jgi:hypothetical protein